MSLFRACVDAMSGYQPGEQPPAGSSVIKLNTNENPYPPSPRVAEAIAGELADGGSALRRYSDPGATALRLAASEQTGFAVEQILHGNGSDELLALLIRALVEPGQRIAFPYPTYVLYETLADAQGVEVERHEYPRDFALPQTLYRTHAKIVFVASPNSPSGTLYERSALADLADALVDSLLVVDEAYVEFADSSALDLVRSHDNVAVLRTLSKSHSLAGMRVGLLFGSPALAAGLTKVKDSYNLDRLAIVAGAASLRDGAWTKGNVRKVRATRERLARSLARLGFDVLPSQANFVFARLPSASAAKEVFQLLRERDIIVRYFDLPGLDDGVRITVGTDEEIDALLGVLAAR